MQLNNIKKQNLIVKYFLDLVNDKTLSLIA